MQPRITVITLGVDDLERAVTFYRDGLGLKTDGIVGTEFEHARSPSLTCRRGSSWHSGPAQVSRMMPGSRWVRRMRPTSPLDIMSPPEPRLMP